MAQINPGEKMFPLSWTLKNQNVTSSSQCDLDIEQHLLVYQYPVRSTCVNYGGRVWDADQLSVA